jgi:hypothetical protein
MYRQIPLVKGGAPASPSFVALDDDLSALSIGFETLRSVMTKAVS